MSRRSAQVDTILNHASQHFGNLTKHKIRHQTVASIQNKIEHTKFQNVSQQQENPLNDSFDWVSEVLGIGFDPNAGKIALVRTLSNCQLNIDYQLLKSRNPKILCKFYRSKICTAH